MTLRRPLPPALAALATAIAVQMPSPGLLVGSAKGAPANIILFDSSGTLVQTSDTAWSLSKTGALTGNTVTWDILATPEATATGHTAFSQPTRLSLCV